MKKIFLTFLTGLLLFPLPTQAATFVSEELVSMDRAINDDYYAAGETVRVFSDVGGDLLTLAGKTQVESNISQDLMVLTGELSSSGTVGDDVRALAGDARMNSTIGGDLILAGRNLTLGSASHVGGDALLAAASIFLGGVIEGDLMATGSEIYINADIRGSVRLLNFSKISFGPDARILGSLWYRSVSELSIPSGTVGGEVVFKPIEQRKSENHMPAILAGFSLYSLLATLFFGLFFIWLYRYFILNSATRAYEATLKSLGIGFLILVLTPVAVVILLATTIGIPLALIALLTYIITLYFAKIMAAMLIGYKIVKVDNKTGFGRLFGGFFVGALIYTLIGMVPVFGWILNFLFVLIALGGMTSHSIEVSRELRKKKLC